MKDTYELHIVWLYSYIELECVLTAAASNRDDICAPLASAGLLCFLCLLLVTGCKYAVYSFHEKTMRPAAAMSINKSLSHAQIKNSRCIIDGV